jgi:hypothetical protein
MNQVSKVFAVLLLTSMAASTVQAGKKWEKAIDYGIAATVFPFQFLKVNEVDAKDGTPKTVGNGENVKTPMSDRFFKSSVALGLGWKAAVIAAIIVVAKKAADKAKQNNAALEVGVHVS